MLPFNVGKLVSDRWPGWLQAIAVVLLCVVIALVVLGVLALPTMIRGCGSQPDTAAAAKDAVLEQVRAELDARREHAAQLEQAIEALEFQVEVLREEVAASVQAREEEHDAIDSAPSISDIDAVLKRGIPGASGRVTGRDR